MSLELPNVPKQRMFITNKTLKRPILWSTDPTHYIAVVGELGKTTRVSGAVLPQWCSHPQFVTVDTITGLYCV